MEDLMSAASPAQPQVRRNAAAAPSRTPQPAPQQTHAPERQVTQVFDFSKPRGDDEIRVHLGDIPVMHTSLEADVFAPTLLSRLMDLFGPRR
jgi:hypothetical protein